MLENVLDQANFPVVSVQVTALSSVEKIALCTFANKALALTVCYELNGCFIDHDCRPLQICKDRGDFAEILAEKAERPIADDDEI